MKSGFKVMKERMGRLNGLSILLLLAVITGLTAGLLCLTAVTAQASETGRQPEQDGEIRIEVVGEQSIDDEIIIEDEMVPLAMYSEKPVQSGFRHIVLMGFVLAAAIGYSVYFAKYDEKLFFLRMEAAKAQKHRMHSRRKREGGQEQASGRPT